MGTAPSVEARLHRHADLAGVTASTICLLHCLLTPLAVSLFPNVVPYLPGDAWFHRLIAAGILLFGLAGFVPGYRLHRRTHLLPVIAAGVALILVVAWSGEGLNRTLKLTLSVAGSLLLVTAHLLNRSFCRQCRACSDSHAPCSTTDVD
jgi:hypothetical protein